MFFKRKKTLFISILLSLFIIPFNTLAYSDYVIAGGENIGITINSKGIIIVGAYDNNVFKNSNLKLGDIIIKVNDTKVDSINEMATILEKTNEDSVKITYIRDGNEKEAEVILSE